MVMRQILSFPFIINGALLGTLEGGFFEHKMCVVKKLFCFTSKNFT